MSELENIENVEETTSEVSGEVSGEVTEPEVIEVPVVEQSTSDNQF